MSERGRAIAAYEREIDRLNELVRAYRERAEEAEERLKWAAKDQTEALSWVHVQMAVQRAGAHLTPQQAKIVAVLASKAPKVVSYNTIIDTVEAERTSDPSLKVQVHRIRAAMAKIGLDDAVRTQRCYGLALSAGARDWIAKALETSTARNGHKGAAK